MIALRGVLNMCVEKYHSNTRCTIYMYTHLCIQFGYYIFIWMCVILRLFYKFLVTVKQRPYIAELSGRSYCQH